MRVRLTRTAATAEILSYIAKHNLDAAAAVARQIDSTIARLGDYPEMGQPKYKPAIRMLPLSRFRRYLVFYTIDGDEVVILSVRHGARQPLWEMREES